MYACPGFPELTQAALLMRLLRLSGRHPMPSPWGEGGAAQPRRMRWYAFAELSIGSREGHLISQPCG